MNSRLLTTLLLLLAVLLTVGLAACGNNTETEQPEQDQDKEQAVIEIEDVWSRSTPHMMEGSGIAYMTIINNGDIPDKLVAGKSPVTAFCELHETSQDEKGVMRMRGVKGGFIEIPAHGSARLEPAGLHVMLIDLKEPLETGTSFPLTLKFEQAGEITIDVPVLDQAPKE